MFHAPRTRSPSLFARAAALFALALVGACALIGLAPPRARACSMRHVSLFRQADEAESVALGRWVPGGVRVDRMLKGAARRRLPIRLGTSTCAPEVRPGQPVLVLVGADRRLVAHHQSAVDDPPPALIAALDRYLAGDAAARRALLVLLAAGADEALGFEAAFTLADRPDLLAGATPEEGHRLLEAARAASRRRLPSLALAIARLRPPGAAEVLLARAEDAQYVEDVGLPLELLTGHRMPNDAATPSPHPGERWYRWRMALERRRFAGSILEQNGGPTSDAPAAEPTPAEALRLHFRAWLAAHGADSEGERFGRGFTERGVSVPTATDRRALAEAVRRGPDALTRAFALEACERLLGRSLESVHVYARGLSDARWRELASLCEAGAP